MPRLKREVSAEGIIAVVLLIWQLIGGWNHQSYVVDQVKEALATHTKDIHALILDVGQLKQQVGLHEYQLQQLQQIKSK